MFRTLISQLFSRKLFYSPLIIYILSALWVITLFPAVVTTETIESYCVPFSSILQNNKSLILLFLYVLQLLFLIFAILQFMAPGKDYTYDILDCITSGIFNIFSITLLMLEILYNLHIFDLNITALLIAYFKMPTFISKCLSISSFLLLLSFLFLCILKELVRILLHYDIQNYTKLN